MDSIVIRPWTVLEYFTQASTHATNRGIQNDGEGSVSVNHGGTQTNRHTSNSHNRVYNGTVYIYEAGRHEQDLSPSDPWSNHATARDRWHPGSCGWVLKRELYQRWRSGEISRLWLHGKPGCGKTVICSTIIEDLLEYHKDSPDVKLAYFYFTFSDNSKQSYAAMLLSLVCQFGRHAPGLLSGVTKGADTHALLKVLRGMLASFKALIVLDALDESPEHLRRDLLRRLRVLAEIPNARILATARNEIDIAHSLEDSGYEQLTIRPDDVRDDIQDYAASQLERESRLRRFRPEVKALIERNVCENADGMFRWAVLLLDALSGLRTSSSGEVLKALREFPHDLDEVYTRILQGVPGKDQDRVYTLLRWITYAGRPLRLSELVEALSVRPEDGVVVVEDRYEPEDILRLLTSLVTTIVKYHDGRDSDCKSASSAIKQGKLNESITSRTWVRLAHFTVQEHLESDRFVPGTAKFHLELRAGHKFLTQCCVTYLMHYSNSDVRQAELNDYNTFPLLKYAADSWKYHSLLHGSDDVDYEMKLLMSKVALNSWLDAAGDPFEFDGTVHRAKSLYYVARFGGLTLARRLLDSGAEINARGKIYPSALCAASEKNHLEVVRLLLERGADDLNEALLKSSQNGWLEIVKLLLNKGAGGLRSALLAASRNGHLEIVKLLRDKRPGGLTSALLEASQHGYPEIVKLLLNSRVRKLNYALQLAAGSNHVQVVKLLVDKGAGDLNKALLCASRFGYLEMVKLLLDRSADDLNGALRTASEENRHEVVTLLLDKGADDFNGALRAAAQVDHSEIVKLLVGRGADDLNGALRAASRIGSLELIELLLLDNRADDLNGALQAAASKGKVKALVLLLSKGADLNAQGGEYGTALRAACAGYYPKLEMVKLLLSKGADVNAQGGLHGSALQTACASFKPDLTLVKLLLDKGADVNAQDGLYGSALQAAVAMRHSDVVEVLLANGGDVSAQDSRFGCPLRTATKVRDLKAVQLLRDHGAEVLSDCDTDSSPGTPDEEGFACYCRWWSDSDS